MATPYTRTMQVSFGSAWAGLITVGYRVLRLDGTWLGPRVTLGIREIKDGDNISSGSYGADISFPDVYFKGWVVWDKGIPGQPPVAEPVDPTEALQHLINPGFGPFPIEVTLTNDIGGSPIPNAKVSLWTNDLATLLQYGYTDSFGKKFFNRDMGTYKIIVADQPGFDSVAPVSVVVDNYEIVNVELIPLVFPPPLDPDFCRVRLRAKKMSGEWYEGAEVSFILLTTGSAEFPSDILVGFHTITGFTNELGHLIDPVTGGIGVLIPKSNSITPHMTTGNTTNYKVDAVKSLRFAIESRAFNEDDVDLGVILVPGP